MKWLTALFSIFTLFVLFDELLAVNGSSISEKELAAAVALVPLSTNAKKLAIEADWLIDHEKIAADKKAKAQRDKAAQANVAKAAPEPSYPTLNIAGIDYQLLGIFKGDNLPFILLKAKKSTVKKVIQGDEISTGIILKAVSANKIILNKAGQSIEFKLFEPTKHA